MNQRLPALTARDVIRALERAGFKESRQSGSHCRLIHAICIAIALLDCHEIVAAYR
jgi:predicted RNA binding protein YcfA (HicA-like mRNA interferase family)